MLKSPTISVWGLMSALGSSNVSFTYVGAFILGHRYLGLRLHPDELFLL